MLQPDPLRFPVISLLSLTLLVPRACGTQPGAPQGPVGEAGVWLREGHGLGSFSGSAELEAPLLRWPGGSSTACVRRSQWGTRYSAALLWGAAGPPGCPQEVLILWGATAWAAGPPGGPGHPPLGCTSHLSSPGAWLICWVLGGLCQRAALCREHKRLQEKCMQADNVTDKPQCRQRPPAVLCP